MLARVDIVVGGVSVIVLVKVDGSLGWTVRLRFILSPKR